ncbi:hypothetical protein [uncultured Thiocystis sp.]|uniref:hypothetical protein n=1 Tax=uncultured Thiocystis sp. TaxID=1202134 RepID=UPI0025FDACD9|nr:hypothetical protein [uncultured Thiocystis sp.]
MYVPALISRQNINTLQIGRSLGRLLELGRPVVVVAQGEQTWTGVRERRLAWRIVPAASNEPGSQGR